MKTSVLTATPPPPALLLFGAEDLLVEEAATGFFNRFIAEDATGMNCEILDGDSITTDALISIARSFPMMGERRVIWVRHAEKLSSVKGADPLTAYLKEPSSTTVLLFTGTFSSAQDLGRAIEKNPAAAKKKIASMKFPANVLLQHAPWMEYPAMKPSQVVSWLMDRAQQRQMSITPAAAEYLAERHSSSLREVALEFDKLTMYLGDRTAITEQDVLDVVGGNRTYNVFELRNAFGRRDVPTMITIINRLLEAERQELLILTILSRYVHTLFQLVDVQQTGSRTELASSIGIPSYALSEHLDAVDRLGARTIEQALHEIRAAERLIKSSSTDPLVVLERMISRIFAP